MDVLTVPFANHTSEPPHAHINTPVDYLGDIMVESTWDGRDIGREVQEQFSEIIPCPLLLCIATDGSGPGYL